MSPNQREKIYSPLDIPHSGKDPFTDYSRWRLHVSDGGRHTWHYLNTEEECANWPQNYVDKYWTGQPLQLPTLPKATTPLEAARNGYTFYKHLQSHDGHWPGEFGGSFWLYSGFVIGSYVTGIGFTQEERLEMIRYLMNHANPGDGGWGVHVEGHSNLIGTALNYVSLRILGMSAEHPVAIEARATLRRLGGAAAAPTWAKFWLSILNVYDWEGFNPTPPEFWLLPDWLPIHPHRWWIITRSFYLPMSFLYGVRFKMEENDLICSLRKEIYTTDYYSIYWPAQRNNVSSVDLYTPHTPVLNAINMLLGVYESCALPFLRKYALERVYQLIVCEDENTKHLTVFSSSKMPNLLCRFVVEGPDSVAYRQHAAKRADFMWLGSEGMMVTATNGSQLWDIAFIMQALAETGLAKEPENKESVRMALKWLDKCQIQENPKHYETAYRYRSKGAWPFSTKELGYAVSDCTGESIKAVLCLQKEVGGIENTICDQRLCDAVDTLLPMQQPSGGFGIFEPSRGPQWLELFNTSDSLKDIMLEICFPECTTAVVSSLAIFRKYYPKYRAAEIERAITEGIQWIRSVQQPEGGWFGSWGICFTYATRFALESLALRGECCANSSMVQRACNFLLSKQREDGGWGESYKTSELGYWVEHENSQVVQTAWAVMALMNAKYPHPEPIENGVKLVMSRQLPDGSWPQEAVEGMLNRNCMITYPNYKFSFTIWMLGRAHRYLQDLKERKDCI